MQSKKWSGSFFFNLNICLIFLFAWFESFAIVNVPSLDWGLQFSWFILLIFSFLYVLYMLGNINKMKIIHLDTRDVFIIFFVITVLDMIYMIIFPRDVRYEGTALGINIVYKTSELLQRSIFHTLYIIFLSISNFLIYNFLQRKEYEEICYFIKKYFITIPFFFIGIWGVYQWLSTYDVIPYIRIFNNNLATGFTYLRFKGGHRCSSIFPEPSAYAYFLGFYLPICLSFFSNSESLFVIKQNKKNKFFVMSFYLLQCCLCKSFSFFAILPIILFFSIFYLKLPRKIKKIYKIIYIFFVCIIVLLAVILFGERVTDILKGTDSSMLVRLSVFYDGLLLFLNKKILGYGYGCIRGMDLISATLAFFGIIGFIALIFFVLKLLKKGKNNHISNVLAVGYLCFITVGCICNPIYEFVPFWIIPIIIELVERKGVKNGICCDNNL